MVGIQQSSRAPSTLHPYGYGPARFAYALISATGVFFLGCGVSLYHAVGNLLDPSSHLVEFSPLILNVMLFSLIVESITCVYAVMVVRRLCAASGMRFWQYLREGTDTTAIAVVVEDLVAVAGILTASAALYATYTTGNAIWDTVGTLAVGLGMGAVAVFLISRNLNVIMGKSFSVSQQRAIMNVLRSRPSVLSIHDMKTVTYGENDHRFKAEVQFHGRQLAKQVLYGPAPEVGEFWRSQTDSLKRGHMLPHTDGALAGRALLHMLQNPSAEGMTKHSAEDLLLRYGDEIVSEVGREVDSVERLMKINFPFITHVDLESHVPVFASQEQDQYLSSKTKALDAVSSTADDSFTSSFTFEAYANAEPLPIFAMDSLYSEQAQSVNSFDKPVIGKFPVATADETNATTSSSINNSEQNKKSL
jgi:zinc transporter 9